MWWMPDSIFSEGGILWAGMPSVGLTEIAVMRLSSISFFLLALVLTAFGVQLIWSRLRRDFTGLPELSFAGSFGLVSLWGMLFVVVLTMISGARELLTPGAWEKSGANYRLKQPADWPASNASAIVELSTRREKIRGLYLKLTAYAQDHGGRMPASADDSHLPAEAWDVPVVAAKYVYVPPASADESQPSIAVALLREPQVFGADRLVLYTDGEIRLE